MLYLDKSEENNALHIGWIHTFISNAKALIVGACHGLEDKAMGDIQRHVGPGLRTVGRREVLARLS